MTEPRPNDETKRRFEQLLAAKKAGRRAGGDKAQAPATKLPPPRADHTFRRRKV
jgi:hypothetical protein